MIHNCRDECPGSFLRREFGEVRRGRARAKNTPGRAKVIAERAKRRRTRA
ncbi:hypothetical protein NCCP2331_22310 [Sporosarcina sp. NCCP-2331]|nr:hypothetical protein NCCP2331_22310 [Sporosarcina sp. NCCP-2331]GLB56163.1 hypothetical protein NCCP2378_19500 [Sporosarcina sp. NCCP-2378]